MKVQDAVAPLSVDNDPRLVKLEINQLTKHFGGLTAVLKFDLAVREKELAGLIGPNGAGKTTVFNMITGIYIPSAGSIKFDGLELSGMAPHDITHLGIARTFQNVRLFQNLTVLDNVRIAYHAHAGYGLPDSILRTPHFGHKENELTERAQDFLAVFNLQDRQGAIAKNLPYGEQRRLEIARALAAEPVVYGMDTGTDGERRFASVNAGSLERKMFEAQ